MEAGAGGTVSILDQQARLRTIGKLRLGKKGPKGNPVKLDTWRFTSPSKDLIGSVSERYGGEVEPWDGEWQVVSGASSLAVEVAPQNIDTNQWLELWGKSGLLRRCDGETCILHTESGITERPCICDETGNRECSPHTAAFFFLPEVAGIGVWRLDTTGWNAAAELAAMVPLLQGSGATVTLRIEHRETRQPGQPRHDYVVPVIDAPISLQELRESRSSRALSSPPSTGLPQPSSPPPDETILEMQTEATTGSDSDPPASASTEVLVGEVQDRQQGGGEDLTKLGEVAARAVAAAAKREEQQLLDLAAVLENNEYTAENIEFVADTMYKMGRWTKYKGMTPLQLVLKRADARHLDDIAGEQLGKIGADMFEAARNNLAKEE